MSPPRHYPTDLSDRQWEVIAPLLPCAKQWEVGCGRPPCDRRLMVNGIVYVTQTGCQWRMLPKDDGRWSAVYSYLRAGAPKAYDPRQWTGAGPRSAGARDD